jgi:hypothetical protein
MMLTHFEALIAALVGLGTLLSLLLLAIRWIYHQGSAATEQIMATKANTVATEELSTSFKAFSDKVDGTITDHEKRITRLEAHEDTRGRQGKQP